MLFKPVSNFPEKSDSVTKISSRFRWKIQNFSRFNNYLAQVYYSDVFKFGSYKWRLAIYPKGKDNDNHISIFLENAGSLGFSSTTWHSSSSAAFGSSIAFTGTGLTDSWYSKCDSRRSPIGSSSGLASANSGSSFSLASTNSGPSSSLSSVNLDSSSYSCAWPNVPPPFGLSSRNHLQNIEYSLSVLDQIHNKYTVRKEGRHVIDGQNVIGFTSFMPLSQLNDPGRGYLANDTCIIEAEIGFPRFLMNSSQKTVADKSTETEPQVLFSVQTISDSDPVGVKKAHSEPEEEDQVTKMETLLKCEVATEFKSPTSVHLCKITPMIEYNLAGHLFEDGRHGQGTVFNKNFEDVGGFSVLKTQVPLYKQIWLKYGHIATSQVLMDSYSGQVSVVSDIMNSVLDMNQQRVSELSCEMIEAWEKKIKMAEKLEFNISWLREWFELVKEDFYGVQKLQTALAEHAQAKARVVAAEEQLMLANNEMKNARESLSVLETTLTPLLFQKKMYEEKGTRMVLEGLL